jgi:hypothetical protein
MHSSSIEGRGPPRSNVSYMKPRLERLGTFRELTRSGGADFSDMWTVDGADGCIVTSSSYTCNKP